MAVAQTKEVNPPNIKTLIVEAFPKDKEMVAVAYCESSLEQYDKEGKVVENPKTHDIGVFQINPVHFQEAEKLGFDLSTVSGNIGFAQWLLKTEGLNAWYSSAKCWTGNLTTLEKNTAGTTKVD